MSDDNITRKWGIFAILLSELATFFLEWWNPSIPHVFLNAMTRWILEIVPMFSFKLPCLVCVSVGLAGATQGYSPIGSKILGLPTSFKKKTHTRNLVIVTLSTFQLH